MRTHQQIIEGAKGPAAFGKAIGVDPNTVKQWKRLNSIPAKHWKTIVTAGFASWDELGTAAAARGGISPEQGFAA